MGRVPRRFARPVAEAPDELQRVAFGVRRAVAGERHRAAADLRRVEIDPRDRPVVEGEQARRQLERQETALFVR